MKSDMDNMEIYNRLRQVPEEAKKPIGAGRLKGMTDINPMWRIKMLTEAFGPCGFGWRIGIKKMWTEAGASGVVSAFVLIDLYVKKDDQWSDPIPGIGGAAFVSQEKGGLYTSDEAYKMAYTDAISIACKSLGMAADVYYAKDRTKYDCITQPAQATQPVQDNRPILERKNFNSDALLSWIHKKKQEAKEKGKPLPLFNIVDRYYRVSNEDIQEISKNYEQYIINNNLM